MGERIYCCQCKSKVEARLTNGAEIYPHRDDLHNLPFWCCDRCRNYVGCHHKTSNPTQPLGVIPNDKIRKARQHIHKLVDPIWKSGLIKRNALYREIGKELGANRKYHTANIRSVDEARDVYKAVQAVARRLYAGSEE